MISKKNNYIFIHIPKTGGTSIEELVFTPSEKTAENLWMGFTRPGFNKYQTGGLQHLLASQVLIEVGKDFFLNSYKFTMVRDPFDKLVSQFTYMQQREDLRAFIDMSAHCTFEQYLELISKKKHVQWELQYKFIYDDNGNQLVDNIMRYEHFDEHVTSLLKKLNLSHRKIPHLNKGIRSKMEHYFSLESCQRVSEMYSDDYKLFGYHLPKHSESTNPY